MLRLWELLLVHPLQILIKEILDFLRTIYTLVEIEDLKGIKKISHLNL